MECDWDDDWEWRYWGYEAKLTFKLSQDIIKYPASNLNLINKPIIIQLSHHATIKCDNKLCSLLLDCTNSVQSC